MENEKIVKVFDCDNLNYWTWNQNDFSVCKHMTKRRLNIVQKCSIAEVVLPHKEI